MPVWARLGACTVVGAVASLIGFIAVGYALEGGGTFGPALVEFLWTTQFLQVAGLTLLLTLLGFVLGIAYAAWQDRPLWYTVPLAAGALALVWAIVMTGFLGLHYAHWYEAVREVACFPLPFVLGTGLAAWIWQHL